MADTICDQIESINITNKSLRGILKNGKISRATALIINFTLYIKIFVLLVITKLLAVTNPQLSIDFGSVVLLSLTLIYCQVTINQLADMHLQSITYYWTVQICRISDKATSLLPLSETYLKVLTIVSSLILLKKPIFIVYYSVFFTFYRS